MKRRTIIWIVVIVALLGYGKFLYDFGPGTCPRCEVYVLDMQDSLFIHKVEQFKKLNPQYAVPASVGVYDGRSDSNSHQHNFYFYYPDGDQIIYTFAESNFDNPENKTDFAFVSVNDGLTLGNWSTINDDFSSAENAEQKKKFKETILNAILKN